MSTSTLTVAQFVDEFFNRVLYQPDDLVAVEVLSADLSIDAQIK